MPAKTDKADMIGKLQTKLFSKTPSFWTLQLLGWSAYGVFMVLTFLPMLSPRGSLSALVLVKSARTLFGFGLSSVMRLRYRRTWQRSPSLTTVAVVSLVHSALGGLAWMILGNGFAFAVDPHGLDWATALSKSPKETLEYTYALLTWSAIYFIVKYRQTMQAERERALQATAAAAAAQLEMLRYQLNPHFLFNSLNSIRAAVTDNPRTAKLMITELSDFLRYSLLKTDSTDVRLRDEIEAVKNYLAIEKIRFEEKLDVDFDIDPAAADVSVPAFLIHPLVENAVKHGMKTGPKPLKIRVSARLADDLLRVEVANTGAWTAERPLPDGVSDGTGTGLQNVRRRLAHFSPTRNGFRIGEEDGWVRAVLEIASTRSPAPVECPS